MKKLLSLSTLLCLLPTSAMLNAAIVTETSQVKPDENVIVSINAHSTLLDGRRWQYGATTSSPTLVQGQKGQTFFVDEAFDLKEVVFRVAVAPTLQTSSIIGANALGANFSLKIYLFENNTSISPIEEVYSDTGTLPEVIAKGDYLHFELSEGVKLQAGKQYGVALFFKDSEMNQYINLMNGATYSSGKGLQYTDTGWAEGGVDYELHLVAIPEASSLAMMFLGGTFAATLAIRSRQPSKARD